MTANSTSSTNITKKSTIKLDVSIRKQALNTSIEQYLDKLLSQQEDVEHNYYKLRLKRTSSIDIKKIGKTFQIEFSLSAQIIGVGIMKRVNSDGTILLKSTLEYQIDDNFNIKLTPIIQDPDWMKLPNLHLGRSKINILKIANVILNNRLNDLRSKISNSDKLKIDLNKYLTPYVNQYKHQSISFNHNQINIDLNPITLELSDFFASDNHYTLLANMCADPIIYDSNINIEPTHLNSFRTTFSQNNNEKLASLFVQVIISFQLIEKIINKKLNLTPIELLGKPLKCSVVNINFINFETIKVDIQTDHNTLKSFTLQSQLIFDPILQKIKLENIDIQLTKTNLLGRAIMLFERPIIQYFSNKINPIQLQPITANVMTLLDQNIEQLNNKKHFELSLQKENLIIENIILKKEQLLMMIKFDHFGHIKLEKTIQLPIL